MADLSKDAQDLLMKVQSQNQQLQAILAQKQNLDIQEIEAKEALKEIEGREEIYKEVAGLLIKAEKKKIKEELEEALELIKIKKKQFSEQEAALKKDLEGTQSKLMGFLGGGAGQVAG
ncbi:MAG: prefoldin subunit [Candidatus Aenigmatarchaeota archaeon]